MAILSKGKTFTSGDQVTATSLNELVDNATFASGAVDDSTTQLSNGRIIVKDAGITSSKLNLSVNGASQNIAQFKTVQGSSARALSIRTPASTSDLNSPFEIETENAIKFLVDDHTVTIDSDGKTIFGNGNIATTYTSLYQVNINTDDALGGTAGNEQGILRLVENSSHADSLLFTSQRVSDGSDWQTAAHRIQRKIDNTKMGYMQFGNYSETNGGLITFGENETERMRIDAEGHVGIGTTSPSTNLEIKASNNTDTTYILKLINSAESGFTQLGAYGIDTSAIDLILKAGGNEGLRVDKDTGRVSIGTTNPASLFEVAGASDPSILLKSTGTGASDDTILRSRVGGTAASNYLYFGDSGKSSAGMLRYVHSDDSMRIYINDGDDDTDSVERLRIKSDGNVGIGTTSPLASIDVARGTGSAGTAAFRGTNRTSNFNFGTDENTIIRGGKTTSDVILNDNGGNVGIGTTSPSSKLEVTGTVKSVVGTGAVELNGSDGSIEITRAISSNTGPFIDFKADSSDDHDCRIEQTDDDGLAFTTGGEGSAAKRVTILKGGNVGIGTTSPSAKLTIEDSGHDLLILNTTGADDARIKSNRGLQLHADHEDNSGGSQGNIDLCTNGSIKMRVQDDGNVGIGTTSPENKLEVAGTISTRAIAGTNNGMFLQAHKDGLSKGSRIELDDDNASTPFMIFQKASYNHLSNIAGTDIVIVGSQSNTNTLKVIGNIQYTGDISDISDRRLKENIEPLTGSLDKICQLEAKSYTMIDDEDKTEELGFIAQDVQQIFPNLVKENTDDEKPEDERGDPYLSVSYMQLIAPMVEAIKELKSENEALKTRVAALES